MRLASDEGDEEMMAATCDDGIGGETMVMMMRVMMAVIFDVLSNYLSRAFTLYYAVRQGR